MEAIDSAIWRALFRQIQIGKKNRVSSIKIISTESAQEIQKSSSRLSVVGSQLRSSETEKKPLIFTDFTDQVSLEPRRETRLHASCSCYRPANAGS